MRLAALFVVVVLVGCSGASPQDAGALPEDSGSPGVDAGVIDSGVPDAGSNPDAGEFEDAGSVDAGSPDAGPGDGGSVDAGATDAGSPCSVGNGGCDPLTQCTSLMGQVTCGACPTGYTGDGATGCADVNECTTLADAGCSGAEVCANTPGAFFCTTRATGTVLFDLEDAPPVGNTGATARLQPCPRGTVSIGYSFGSNSLSRITSASAFCSPLTLSGSAATGFTLGTTLPAVVLSEDRVCPANEVVTGVGVGFSTQLTSLTVRCAPLSVQASSAGFQVITGTPHALLRYPGASSPAPNLDVACPANDVGSGETVFGGAYLFAFGLRCVRPALAYDVPPIAFGTTTDSPLIGINAGTADSRDVCPAGQLVTGVQLESSFRSFAVECGTPVFDLPQRVGVSPADPLPHRGLIAPTYASRCPWDAALTRIDLFTQGNYILGGLGLSCAPFTAASAPSWNLSVGATSVAVPAPPYPGTPKTTECPAGQVAVGVHSSLMTQSNGYRTLSHVGLICAAPQAP